MVLCLAVGTLSVSAQKRDQSLPELRAVLEGVEGYLRDYFSRAQSIVSDETVVIQEVGPDMMALIAPPRTLKSEVRISWEPSADGTISSPEVLRATIAVNGRAPREKDRDKCFDPGATSPELLAQLFVPPNSSQFSYRVAGRGRIDGRPTVVLEVKDTATGPVEIIEKPGAEGQSCKYFPKPGVAKWRVSVDAERYVVLRVEESLYQQYEVTIPADRVAKTPRLELTVERSEQTTEYKPIKFTEPDEVVYMPVRRSTLSIVKGSPTPRKKWLFSYKNYRRFMTGGRIIQ